MGKGNKDISDIAEIKNQDDLMRVLDYLTEHERLYCEDYVKHFNKAKAARNAGYSEESCRYIGYENSTKPHIKLYIEYLKAQRHEQAQVALDDLLISIKGIANVDIADLFHKNGQAKNPDEIDEDVRRAISGVKIKTVTKTIGDIEEVTTEYDYKLPDKNKALETLMRHKGELTDKKVHEAGTSMADLFRKIEETKKAKETAES